MNRLANLVLLLLAVALLLSLRRGGWSGHGGVRDWLRAKFLGKATA